MSGEQVRKDVSNYVTIADNGYSAIAVAKIDGTWTSAETNYVSINGWQTSAYNYIRIYTTIAARHNGKWSTDKYRISGAFNSSGCINLYSADSVKIDGLQLENSYDAAATNGYGIREFDTGGGGNFEVSNCIIRYSGSTTPDGWNDTGYMFYYGPSTVKIYNTMIIGFGIALGDFGSITTGSTYYIYNNTFKKCGNGGYAAINMLGSGNMCNLYLKNNLVQDNTCYNLGTFTIFEHSNNLSSDNTSPDVAFQNSIVSFVNEGGGYYLLASKDHNRLFRANGTGIRRNHYQLIH